MTPSNAAVDKASAKTGTDKGHDKLAEKRRALGRGLESLLPGPRPVPAAPTLPQSARKDGTPDASIPPQTTRKAGAPDLASSQFLVPGSQPDSQTRATAESAVSASTLDQLHGAASGAGVDGETVIQLPLKQIDRNPYQTRENFERDALEELATSIEAQGVVQPIVVRPAGKEGRFILILGERRMRASEMLGKETIPAIVKRVSNQQAAEMTLVENLQRQDLSCLEQAAAFARLSRNFQMTQEQIGERVGCSREQVSNYMRLLQLPYGAHTALQKGYLTYSHARLLLSLNDDGQIEKVAEIAIRQKMSVARLEDFIRDMNAPEAAGPDPGGARWVDPNVRAAQRSLETVLGMRVRIRDRKGKGKITIEYGTLEDFDRIVQMLKGK